MKTTETKTCQCAAHNSDECICGAWDDLDPHRLRDQLAAARSTNTALNRRCQQAESIIAASGIVEGRPQGQAGRSLGRALANYAAAKANAKLEDIKRRIFGEHYASNRNEDAVAAVAHVMQQLDASRAECARLRCSLITFGSHKVGCDVYRNGRPCNCGFGDVAYPRAALSAPTEPKKEGAG